MQLKGQHSRLRACGTPAETLPGSPLQGVRSLQLHGHLLSAGSSMSALSFLDLRMRAWLAVDGPKPRPIQTQVDDYSVSQADEAITALQASLLGYVLVQSVLDKKGVWGVCLLCVMVKGGGLQ